MVWGNCKALLMDCYVGDLRLVDLWGRLRAERPSPLACAKSLRHLGIRGCYRDARNPHTNHNNITICNWFST